MSALTLILFIYIIIVNILKIKSKLQINKSNVFTLEHKNLFHFRLITLKQSSHTRIMYEIEKKCAFLEGIKLSFEFFIWTKLNNFISIIKQIK